jgi:F-type H+-transporting ATPase subunit delta
VSSATTGSSDLSGRYATALYELAESEKILDEVSEDLQGLGAMIRESDDMSRLIRSPVISRQDQDQAMDALMEKAGVCDLTRRFIGVVARNRRLFALPGIVAAFQGILAGQRGETTAEVVSANELTQDQLDAIGASLKKAVGGKVAIDASVDAGLLGGLIVKIGSRMVDSSLRTKLQQLRLVLRGVGS